MLHVCMYMFLQWIVKYVATTYVFFKCSKNLYDHGASLGHGGLFQVFKFQVF